MTDPTPTPDPIPVPDPPDPTVLPDLDVPVLDLGREAIRQALVQAKADATDQIVSLRADFAAAQQVLNSSAGGVKQLRADLTATQAALAQAQSDIAALQTAVAALQPPAPTP